MLLWGSRVVQLVKNLPAIAGDARDEGVIPEYYLLEKAGLLEPQNSYVC